MTRYEVLRNRTIEEVASDNIEVVIDTDSYDYLQTSDGEQFSLCDENNRYYVVSEVKEKAYQHELAYLKEEADPIITDEVVKACPWCGSRLLLTGVCTGNKCLYDTRCKPLEVSDLHEGHVCKSLNDVLYPVCENLDGAYLADGTFRVDIKKHYNSDFSIKDEYKFTLSIPTIKEVYIIADAVLPNLQGALLAWKSSDNNCYICGSKILSTGDCANFNCRSNRGW